MESSESGAGKCEICVLTVDGTLYCSRCKETTMYPQNSLCAPKAAQTPSCIDDSIVDGVRNKCADGFFKMNRAATPPASSRERRCAQLYRIQAVLAKCLLMATNWMEVVVLWLVLPTVK